MIIGDEKKTIATIIASRRSAKGEKLGRSEQKAEIVKTEDGELDGRHVAAQDILHALSAKSPEQLMQALSNFQDLHSTSAPGPVED